MVDGLLVVEAEVLVVHGVAPPTSPGSGPGGNGRAGTYRWMDQLIHNQWEHLDQVEELDGSWWWCRTRWWEVHMDLHGGGGPGGPYAGGGAGLVVLSVGGHGTENTGGGGRWWI